MTKRAVVACHDKTSPLRSEHTAHHSYRGFTLIEILVVVTIIALMIAILLPSLSRARQHARTTLDSVRIAGLARAMVLYALENNDTPPFIGRGWEDLDGNDEEEWPPGSGLTVGMLKRLETWCVNRPEDTWFTPQQDWPADVGVEHGSLFQYTRFKDLYLCPEFQRVAEKYKAQSEFNFTRTILGRKWYVKGKDPEAEGFNSSFGAPGPIMKLSEIYSPAKMWLLMDEWYLRHCASPENDLLQQQPRVIEGGWMANDCMNFYLGDELGRYHGTPVEGLSASGAPIEVSQGHVAHYDGHVELYRDVLPGRSQDFTLSIDTYGELVDFMVDHLFAQRGITIETVEQLTRPSGR